MSFLSKFFPTIADVRKTSKELKKAENTVERRDKQIESLQETLKGERADLSDFKFYKELDMKRVERTHVEAVENERDSSARLIRNAEADVEYEENSYESRLDFATETAEIDARKRVQADVTKLQKDLSEANVSQAHSSALASERQDSLDRLDEENSRLREVLTEILKKVPNVTLDKFNINVEIPPAKVEIITTGKGGGGKEDN